MRVLITRKRNLINAVVPAGRGKGEARALARSSACDRWIVLERPNQLRNEAAAPLPG